MSQDAGEQLGRGFCSVVAGLLPCSWACGRQGQGGPARAHQQLRAELS